MPLTTEEDYERLGAHLAAIDAPLATFATSHGYTLYPPRYGGRYPNRRLTQHGTVIRSIHISMDSAPNGQRFDRFFPDIPYIIWGGAWVDDPVTHIRFSSPDIRTWALPFSALLRTLPLQPDHFHIYLSALTEEFVRECGTTSHLPPFSPESNS